MQEAVPRFQSLRRVLAPTRPVQFVLVQHKLHKMPLSQKVNTLSEASEEIGIEQHW